MEQRTTLGRYNFAIERLKANGYKLLAFQCPACKKEIQTQAAPEGEKWDSFAECPHCESFFAKITQGGNAWGVLVEGLKLESNPGCERYAGRG